MSFSAFSSEKITIAWAARVSFAQLGARLLSYFDTRASITTFRLAARYTSSTAFRKLPEELISIIANQVSHQSFCEDMRDWVQAEDCLAERCTTLVHLGMFCSREDGRICPLEIGSKNEQANEDHFDKITKYGDELINEFEGFKMAKYVR
ncbi:MAG: hypothetical protein L6R42_008957, partial [Xanthoria sp. 1 TBL-2021]